jgi:hypothetical protein
MLPLPLEQSSATTAVAAVLYTPLYTQVHAHVILLLHYSQLPVMLALLHRVTLLSTHIQTASKYSSSGRATFAVCHHYALSSRSKLLSAGM